MDVGYSQTPDRKKSPRLRREWVKKTLVSNQLINKFERSDGEIKAWQR